MKKNILITGSTDGLGKLVSYNLAKAGHRVYLHGRNSVKLQSTLAELRHETGNEEMNGFVADFSNLRSVKKMAVQVMAEVPQLDVLINNAGVYNSPSTKNDDGLDMRVVVNYLAPYLLTSQILSLLENTPASRIINLSSAAQSSVNKELLVGKLEVSAGESYAQSKLALTMWSYDLARKYKDISVIVVNPGSLLNTKMVAEAYGKFWSPAEKGSDLLYDLAIAERYQQASGKYFDNDKGAFSHAHPDTYDQEKVNDLIALTDQVLSKATY